MTQGPVVYAVERVEADYVVWRQGGRTFLTVVAKIEFAFAPNGTCPLVGRPELVASERHLDRSPLRSVEAPSDRVPFLPHPEVLVVGHAYAPGGRAAPSLTVNVSLSRERPVFRKSILVLGDRAAPDAVPAPFARMPLTWEHALRGEANPIGVDPARRLPNLVDPQQPDRPAGLGPVSELWAPRRARLAGRPSGDLRTEPLDLPDGFDAEYFQAAPPDQWLSAIVGDELLVLDRLHPSLARVWMKLPGARLVAWLSLEGNGGRGGPASGAPIELRPDRLLVHVDRMAATLSYRGAAPIAEEALPRTRVAVGLSLAGGDFAWPDPTDPSTARPHVLRAERPRAALEITAALDDDARASAAAPPLPFVTPPRAEPPQPAGPRPSGALPFATPPAVPFAQAPPPPDPSLAARPSPFAAQPSPPADVPPPSAFAPPPSVLPPSVGPPSVLPASVPAPFAPPPPPAGPPSTLPVSPHATAEPAPPRVPTVGTAALPFAGLPFAQSAAAPPATRRGPDLGGLPFVSGAPVDEPSIADAPPEGPRTPPPRTGDEPPAIVDGPFHLATIPWQIRPPTDSLTILVKGSFELIPNEPARPCDDPELPIGDVYVDDDPQKPLVRGSDFAILKHRVDVLFYGHAYPPGGRSPAMQASLRLRGPGGRIDRTLYVLGDRTWQRALVAIAPTDPAPFERMPIVWERAFGGPGVPANPGGVGHGAKPDARGVARLPNLEVPGKLIQSPTDSPPPICLGAISPQWPQRMALLGTYDKAWFRTRWPYFPEDFDYEYFQCAPVEQRLDRVTGDEEYELVGLVPGHPAIAGRLPGIRVRCFALRTAEAGGNFIEIPVRIDTVTFDGDACRVHLVWRGTLEVSDDDAPEIAQLFVTSEPLAAEPMTLARAEERYRACLAAQGEDDEGPPAPLDDAPAPPEAAEPEEPDPDFDAMQSEQDAREAALAAELERAGHLPPPGKPAEPMDPEAIAAQLRASGATDEEVAEVLAALEPEPDVEAPPLEVDLRKLVEEHIARGEPLERLDLHGADLRGLDLGGQRFTGSDLSRAQLDGAKLAGADFTDAILARASLADCDCTGARFVGADLSEAVLDRAKLDGAALDGAELHGARGQEASLRGATAEGAVFEGAVLVKAHFEGAKLTGADLSAAVLDGAVLDGAALADVRLYDARGRSVSFSGCDMTGARAEGASLFQSRFDRVLADDSIWERAELTGADFTSASLRSASFVRARCFKAKFEQADLSAARLRRAKLNGSSFAHANLMEASLERADFELCDLRGANLHAAAIFRTGFLHANLDRAIVSYSALGRKQP